MIGARAFCPRRISSMRHVGCRIEGDASRSGIVAIAENSCVLSHSTVENFRSQESALRCFGPFAALLLPNRIRLWNFSQNVPARNFAHPSGTKMNWTNLRPNGTQVLGFRHGNEPDSKLPLSIDSAPLAPKRERQRVMREESIGA